jgi:hypothetical protein
VQQAYEREAGACATEWPPREIQECKVRQKSETVHSALLTPLEISSQVWTVILSRTGQFGTADFEEWVIRPTGLTDPVAEVGEVAKKFEFERAARLRDSIKELREKEFLFG